MIPSAMRRANRAYVYAMKMHGSQLGASGDPYFAHPIRSPAS
jgi:(p)ppGpp synthase/HD superfamily hydrolase